MYKNLKAEMLKQDITLAQIALAINKKPDTTDRKINGKININIEECKAIAKLFIKDNTLEYLFAR